MTDISYSAAAAAYRSANKATDMGANPQGGAAAIAKAAEERGGPSFSQLVGDALRNSAGAGYKSEEVSTRAIANEADLHELITSVSNAELTLNTVVAVRDRVISAYQDIVKMPI